MSTQRFCEQCGAALREGVKFCEDCGAPVGAVEESRPTTPPGENRPPPPVPVKEAVAPTGTEQIQKPVGHPVLKAILVVVALGLVGVGGWWFGQNRGPGRAGEVAVPGAPAADPGSVHAPAESTPNQSEVATETTPPDPDSTAPSAPPGSTSVPDPTQVALPPGLVDSGDFTNSIPRGIEGDGGRWEGPNAGNWSWRFVGPDDMMIAVPLKPTPGAGTLAVSFLLAIPEGTPIDPAFGGIRVRTRLQDRHESSAVADVVLQAAGDWQVVSPSFEDTGSGPYTLWIEVLGFTGAIYLDQLSVTTGAGAVTVTPEGAPGLPKQEAQVPVETWFAKQPWMRDLVSGLPPGVTLEVFAADMAGSDGHYAVELRENHAPGSGFDPGEAPRWGIFQVSKDLNEVRYLNPQTNRAEPVDVFLAEARARMAALAGAPGDSPGDEGMTELERWVRAQDWFRKLEGQMPAGVTLSILQRDDGFEGWTAFEIREHHAPGSGFDPDVVPLVGIFEVSPQRDEMEWHNPVSDEWEAVESFLASRGL